MTNKQLVLQTEFGLADGAVSTMYGVAKTVAPALHVADLTHEITPYNIWEASYRLYQTLNYWPVGTTFVSVVDPGVGSERKSVCALTKTGHYVITPDNGTLTHIAKFFGLKTVCKINETTSRLPHSDESHTFHGRDVYAYNGARLASGQLDFSDIGPKIDPATIVKLPLQAPIVTADSITGMVDILDVRFGSLWTNISLDALKQLNITRGDQLLVTIYHDNAEVYQAKLPFVRSFAQVALNEPLLYINSLVKVGIALNQASFAQTYQIGTGHAWKVTLRKLS